MKTLTKDMVKFTITPEEEHASIDKALGFEFTGADHSDYIKKVKRDNGRNIWLWCTIKVTASFQGLEGTAYLGCCAYRNEKDFIAGGYYEQMQDEAFDELKEQVDAVVNALA